MVNSNMKKYLHFALFFAIYGLCCGVFFREFTKLNGFDGRTMLGMAHPHVLMLGLGGYLLISIFVKILNIDESKKMNIANAVYIAGIIIASVMMLVRGSLEVVGYEMTKSLSAAISGIAGIGHIAVAAGIIRFIGIFKRAA